MSGEQGRITPAMAVGIIATIVGPTAILTLVGATIAQAKQDAWISGLLLIAYGLIIVVLAGTLARRFPRKSLLEMIESLLGRPGRWILGALYTWWLLHTTAGIIRIMAEFVLITMLPKTPIVVIIVSLVVVVVFAARGGIEVLGRTTQLLFPVMPMFLVLIVLLSAPEFRTVNLLPIMEMGVVPSLRGAFPGFGFFGEVILATIVAFPFLNQPRTIFLSGVTAVLMIGAIFLVATIASVMLLGANVAGAQTFPFVGVARYINIGEFLDRLDPLIIFAWFFGIAIKVMIWFYATVLTSAQWLGLKDFRPVTLPIGLIMIGLGLLLYESLMHLGDFSTLSWSPYAAIFELLIPLALLLIAQLRPVRTPGGSQR